MPTDNSTNDWGNILSGLAGVGGTLYANNQASSGANSATNMAQFKGVNIGMPGGQVSGQNNGGQLNYNVNSPLTQNANQFQGLATAFGNNAQSGAAGNPYLAAGNKALDQFSQFNPQQFANQQYQNMSAMAAPGNTDQTQAMLNYEHATGRGGVTQNGQLGDLGGLALAQSTADNGRRLQAQQLGVQQQNTLATNAQNLLQSGLGMNSSNLNNSLASSQGSLGINDQLMQLLRTAIGGQASQANAGANAAQYQYRNGVNQANSTGNLLGGLLQGGANGGASVIGGALNGLKGLFSGGGNAGANMSNYFGSDYGTGGYNGTTAAELNGYGASGTDQFNFLNGGGTGSDPSSSSWGDYGYGGGFNGAGGQAASSGLQNLDYSNPDSLNLPQSNYSFNSGPQAAPSGGGGFGSVGGALSGASSALNIFNGLQRGGVQGDASAALSAGKLANQAGLIGGKGGAGLGAAGSVLGLYNGLQQGGVAGYTNAALSGAALGAQTGAFGAASAGVGAAAGALALPLGVAMYALGTNPVDLNKSYWQGMEKSLQAGKPGPNATPQQMGDYWNTVTELSGMKDNPQAQQMMAKYGIGFYQNPNITQGAAVSRVGSRPNQRY